MTQPKCIGNFCERHICMMVMRGRYCPFAKNCSGYKYIRWNPDGSYDYAYEEVKRDERQRLD